MLYTKQTKNPPRSATLHSNTENSAGLRHYYNIVSKYPKNNVEATYIFITVSLQFQKMKLYVTHLIKHSVSQALCISLQHAFSLIWKEGRSPISSILSFSVYLSLFLCVYVSFTFWICLKGFFFLLS